MAGKPWQRSEFERYKSWRKNRPRLTEVVADAVAGSAVAAAGPRINAMAFLPLSFLSVLVLVALGIYHFAPEPEPEQIGMVVAQVQGEVKATDGMKDWPLEAGAQLMPGQVVFTGKDGKVRLQGSDPDASLLVFEGSRFLLQTLQEVPSASLPAFKLEGKLEMGEVVMKFRSKNSLWGVKLALPQPCVLFCRKVIMFKAATEGTRTDVVVGDGVVAAVGADGERAFIKADQKMVSSNQEPLAKPAGANVLAERWSL